MYSPLDNGPKLAVGQPNSRLKKRKKASETVSSDDSADINLEEFHALLRVGKGAYSPRMLGTQRITCIVIQRAWSTRKTVIFVSNKDWIILIMVRVDYINKFEQVKKYGIGSSE